jgi:antitoxin component of RelBE/YafQ-DinJ toxin-antitoxin module
MNDARFELRIPKSEKQDAMLKAKQRGLSLSELIRLLLKKF